MSLSRIAVAALVTMVAVVVALTPTYLHAQSAARPDTSDAAVAALVNEVKGLRADLAAAARNQLRAQMLLGRVQMQEQRIAYLDKQRSEVASALAAQSMMMSGLRMQAQGFGGNACAAMPNADQRRDCEAQAENVQQQVRDQQAREQQLRTAENDLTNAISTEQARWSEFNSLLDELERSLR